MEKLTPTEAEALYKTIELNGVTYRYILSLPKGGHYKATVFLIHGIPDFSFGWRYQIPFLTSLGLRVVAPDLIGFAGTDAPTAPPADIHLYGFKRACDDLAELARQLDAPKLILGGHDWGGMVAFRFAQWYPELITHVFSVCTPYVPPSDTFYPTEVLVAGPLPQFGYQLQFESPAIETRCKSRDDIWQLLSGLYGGGPPDKLFITPEVGVDLSLIGKCGVSPLLSQEETDYTVDKYTRNGMHGPMNWYRTRKANFEDEKNLKHRKMDIPVLFVQATLDPILTKEMSASMDLFVPKLTRREVPAHHWALWQCPVEINNYVKEWLETVVFGGKSTL